MSQLTALSVSGGRGRAACARVAEFSADLGIALRRAVPFLARRRVAVIAEPPQCISFADLAADATIVHVSALFLRPGSSRALILIDETATARILDGVLGGDGTSSSLGSATLTSAQSALASRVASGMLRAFGDVITTKLGFETEAAPTKDIDAGAAVVVTLGLDGGGRVIVAFPMTSVQNEEIVESDCVDEGVAMAMFDVELDVVAELGKVRLPLEALASLKVGDVLRLALPLDERARVCAGGAVLFYGRPTASGDSVAVIIERQAN